jgi:alkylation response protein AidB-like acyl-CoA dehydrogenase
MNLDLAPDELKFRDELRAFFERETPAAFKPRVRAGVRLEPAEFTHWQKLLHAKGWGAPSWPKIYGGTGWTATQLYLFESEAARADAPMQYHQGLELIGPIIFSYGSEAQKARYLPAIVAGDDWWCQGYSEPNAGSDLASLTTRAVRRGEYYIVQGQKMWTSYAQVSNRMFCLARTDPEARKQAGISLLLMDIDSPGLTIHPIITMDEVHHTNDVFLDEVRVPAENLVGEEGKGWSYGKVLLDRERSVTAAFTMRLSQQLRGLRLCVARAIGPHGRLIDAPGIADRLSQFDIEIMALEAMVMRTMAEAAVGKDSGPRASMIKIRWAELLQHITEFWTECLGYDAAAFARDGIAPDKMSAGMPWPVSAMLYSRVTSIYGGTSEIQRNIIARRALGL